MALVHSKPLFFDGGEALPFLLIQQGFHAAVAGLDGGADVGSLLGDSLRNAGVELVGTVGLDESCVFNHVDAGVQGVDDAAGGEAVGGGGLTHVVGLVDDGAQLLDGVRGTTQVSDGGAAAGGHDLDVVRAVLDELADGGSNVIDAVGLLVAPVEVAARDGDGAAAEEQPRGGDVAALGTLAEIEGDLVAGAVFAEGGDSGLEVDHGVHGGAEKHDFVGVVVDNVLIAGPGDAEHEVGVGVDEAGEQVAFGEAVVVDVWAFGKRNLVLPVDNAYAAALGDDDWVIDDRAAGAVDEGLGLDDVDAVGVEGNGAAGLQSF